MSEEPIDVDTRAVWRAIFSPLNRVCSNCHKEFKCNYTCEPNDFTRDGIRGKTPDFCFCPECFGMSSIGVCDDRVKCHLLNKKWREEAYVSGGRIVRKRRV